MGGLADGAHDEESAGGRSAVTPLAEASRPRHWPRRSTCAGSATPATTTSPPGSTRPTASRSAASRSVGRSSAGCHSGWPGRRLGAAGSCSTARSRSTCGHVGPASHVVIAHFCDAWRGPNGRPAAGSAGRLGRAGWPGTRPLHARRPSPVDRSGGRSGAGSRSTRASSAGGRARSPPIRTGSTSRSTGAVHIPPRNRLATRRRGKPGCWRCSPERGARRRPAWPTACQARPTRSPCGCTRSKFQAARRIWPAFRWSRWPQPVKGTRSSWRPSRSSVGPHHRSASSRRRTLRVERHRATSLPSIGVDLGQVIRERAAPAPVAADGWPADSIAGWGSARGSATTSAATSAAFVDVAMAPDATIVRRRGGRPGAAAPGRRTIASIRRHHDRAPAAPNPPRRGRGRRCDDR